MMFYKSVRLLGQKYTDALYININQWLQLFISKRTRFMCWIIGTAGQTTSRSNFDTWLLLPRYMARNAAPFDCKLQSRPDARWTRWTPLLNQCEPPKSRFHCAPVETIAIWQNSKTCVSVGLQWVAASCLCWWGISPPSHALKVM